MSAAKGKTPADIEARAKLELETRQAAAAADEARRKVEAEQAALARLEAETDLPANATDAQIKEHLMATEVARVRLRQSKRGAEAAEAAAKALVERAASVTREAERQRAFEDQAAIIDRFRATYPVAVDTLFRLFVEAHAIEMAGFKLGGAEGEERYVGAFRFREPDPPRALRVQLIGSGGRVIWQGDTNNDVATQEF